MQSPDSGSVAVLFGTRPEAVKLCPVILALRRAGLVVDAVTTGQHRELLADVLPRFGIVPDGDLELMRPDQSLDYLLGTGIERIGRYLESASPQAVVVQGDTTSTLAAAISAFHHRIPVGHVEAGLRTYDMDFPFPEEMNRRATTVIARWHFAPTAVAAENLAREGIVDRVYVTGNTVVDALRMILETAPVIPADLQSFLDSGPYVLASAHRRESWGEPIGNVARALAAVVDATPGLRVVFVTHPNPLARGPVDAALAGHPRVRILDALPYPQFLKVLAGALVAVSDSGGVQEEGPTLGVPVLVTRAITERPEGISAGAVMLVGTDFDRIVSNALTLVRDPAARAAMSNSARGIYGDGHASERIVAVLAEALR